MDLSVVVPCFNEERGLKELREELNAVLPALVGRYEVVLVDDGSSDGTLDEARRLSSLDRRYRYLSLSRNFGKEAALLAGIREATGDRVLLMDADLQHPPWLLNDMLGLLDSGYDQVVARRDRDGEPRVRSLLSKMYYIGVNKLADVPLEDGVGDFRVLSRRAADAVLAMPESNRFSKGLFAWAGFRTVTLPYGNVTRKHGESAFSFGKLVNYGIDGVVSFNSKPLRAAIYLGSTVTLLAFVYAIYVIVSGLLGNPGVPGYATLMVGIAGFGGMQLLFLGVIGEYVGRIYFESKNRPHYFIQESGGSPHQQSALPHSVGDDFTGLIVSGSDDPLVTDPVTGSGGRSCAD
ncbi:glycosyltransferase family 2 protein [Saccharopolyspora sp. HNM0983]|uniref:Glycosyltransferase family 2 protein n=1 Tax=Saccharopolyspora montiporae TaxID=2781240 RepID=A0A929BC47_9PSEU|nr:glycosyltransferase family 2 protein [Saccharopolyspora sp. HNM0983]MBE9375343.1 glycosyltransferase family 2 protein [Saccharopolyspora sp. HNM0983]